MSTTKAQVPQLADLHQAPEVAFKNDQLNKLLNEAPPAGWLKNHPMVNVRNEQNQSVPLKFLPVDKIEFLLTRIFQRWYVEVLDFKVMLNSIGVSVRLHYFNPYLKAEGEWMWSDGVGAAPVQTNKGAQAFDMMSIKSAAVQIGLPSAESYAFKDAASKIGRIFGRDLNRTGIMEFTGAFEDKSEDSAAQQQISNQPSSNNYLTDLPL